jgi:chaperonin cofactor prefoldin
MDKESNEILFSINKKTLENEVFYFTKIDSSDTEWLLTNVSKLLRILHRIDEDKALYEYSKALNELTGFPDTKEKVRKMGRELFEDESMEKYSKEIKKYTHTKEKREKHKY